MRTNGLIVGLKLEVSGGRSVAQEFGKDDAPGAFFFRLAHGTSSIMTMRVDYNIFDMIQ